MQYIAKLRGIYLYDHDHVAGDVVAKWIACGTLNMHIMGSNLSAASWLTM